MTKTIEYKCDKCGVKFDQQVYEKGECISLTWTRAPYEILKCGGNIDLCSKCSKELILWWKGGLSASEMVKEGLKK